jgi:uncharacterized peroxidase-related enzyme
MENSMPRIAPNTNPSSKAKEQLDIIKNKLGSTPNIFLTFAHSPAVFDFYLSGSGALSGSSLSAGLREQIAVAVAGVNNCDYCASAHTAIGKSLKVSEAELDQNLHAKSADTKTQAALDFAIKIVKLQGKLSDDDLKSIKTAGYNEAEILEILAVTCFNIFTNYFNHLTETEIDFPLVSTKDVCSKNACKAA